MRVSQYFFKLFFITFLFSACNSSKDIIQIDHEEFLDTISVYPEADVAIYQASNDRINDLLHTKLEVTFDWDSSFLYGKAELTLKPYFYPVDSLTLDAKGFQIKEISSLNKIGEKLPLDYTYDTSKLYINLNKTYTQKDTYQIYIDYVAIPDRFETGGSAAITSEKGLYFINPLGEDKDKPRQIWTQGETESSSRWFPTIDSPNEKTSQEIYITVDTIFETLSNGKLLFQTINGDGTRTDYWKQDLKHAPYLFMMAVGDFTIVEDRWRDIPVNYYVEHEYKEFAKEIFPNTPEMLEFFSNKLGYDYPWDKYHQVVVRDYVSGAMENTGAVIFGDFVQGDHRYLIDNSGEDVVAHELFHHWFGDLVTTESWSNLPLNESFATYGEYLWAEHKYGLDEANYGGQRDLRVHLQSSRMDKKKLIRFDYESEMEMFDTHSYQKGGRVLHMLRKEVGDEAFFTALKKYLHEYEYQAAEIHQLRLVFEEVTGRDLNWFFNQWFLSAGNPEIVITKEYNDSLKTLTVWIDQLQEGEDIPYVFLINTDLKIIEKDGKVSHKKIHLNKRNQVFRYEMEEEAVAILFDTDKDILGTIDYDYEEIEARQIYLHAEHYLDKENALSKLKDSKEDESLKVIATALDDEFWVVKKAALKSAKHLSEAEEEMTFEKIIQIADEEDKSIVRRDALIALEKYYLDRLNADILRKHLNDSSFIVVAQALEIFNLINQEEALKEAEKLEKLDNTPIIQTIAELYAQSGDKKYTSFFDEKLKTLDEFDKYAFLISYTEYLTKQNPEDIHEEIKEIAMIAKDSKRWFIRMSAVNSLIEIKETFDIQVFEVDGEDNRNEYDLVNIIDTYLIEIREKESNNNLIKLLDKELE